MTHSIYSEALAIMPRLLDWRHYLHAHAELGYELPLTTAFIKQILDDHAISYSEPCTSTIVADIGKGEDGMVLRADMDALPMVEKSGLPFACQSGNAHTCGHDMHTTMLLGAAVLLKKHEMTLTHRTRLIFQPDEEGARGAELLCTTSALYGSFKGGMALHMSPVHEAGTLYYKKGAICASCDEFIITVNGQGCHGAAPHTGNDPIFAAVQIYNALQGIISRGTSPFDAAVLSVCAFNGGNTNNVVPQEASLLGTMRTYKAQVRETMKARLLQICQGIGQTLGVEVDLTFTTSLPVLESDSTLTTHLLDIFHKEAPSIKASEPTAPFTWSDDFALYDQYFPLCFMILGGQEGDTPKELHNDKVRFNEDALATGTTALVLAAMNI